MKKRKCPLLRIKNGKDEGSVEGVVGLFWILFIAILLCAEMQVSVYQASSIYLEDALAASNLASAVIDIEEYGISHLVRIADPTEAYVRYINAVKENLQLNENWECANSALISGQVVIEQYIVYNVENGYVNIFHVSDTGNVHKFQGAVGSVTSPNGLPIETTAIYSEISFPVKVFGGNTVQAHKGKLVDIVTNK